MKIIKNETLIKRNGRIAQFAMLGGLLVLAGGMFISFQRPEYFSLSLVALFVGFSMSQIGIYFSNRWGRKPRPDELIDQGLKGLDDRYTLFHYESPVSHLLLGPAGVWVFQPRSTKGTIFFSKGRWRQRGGNLYLKIFAQEGIGRPDLEIMGDVDKLHKFLNGKIQKEMIPDIRGALVLTHPDVEINISAEETPPAETVFVGKLKDFIRKTAKSESLSSEKVKIILEAIES